MSTYSLRRRSRLRVRPTLPVRMTRPRLTTPLLPVDGGINLLAPPMVKPNEHTAGANWFLDRDGTVRPRPGNRIYNLTPTGTVPQGSWEYRRATDQVNRPILYAGGTLYRGDDATRTLTAFLAGLSTTADGWAETAQDLLWFTNGVNTPRVTDTATTFRIGIIPMAAAPGVALVALAGNLPAEDHYYRCTYVREEAGVKVRESNPSPESVKVTNAAGSAQNDVTLVASADVQVTHIYVYRRSSLTVPEYKLVSKETNTAHVFRDNVAVSALGAFASWEPSGGLEDHAYPPDTLFSLTLHRDGRFYAWGPRSRVYYTRPLAYHYWPGATGAASGLALGVSLVINEDDGDEGMALLSEGDAVLCLKRYNVYRLLGDGPVQDDGTLGSWLVEKVPTRFGCAAKRSASVGPSGAFWVSDDGPVWVDVRTGVPRQIGARIRPWLARSDDITKTIGIAWGPYYFVFTPIQGVMDGMVFCTLNSSWWPVAGLDVRALAGREDGTLLWAGKITGETTGTIYEWDRRTNDNGRAVAADMTTAMVQAGGHALVRQAIVHAEGNPGSTLTARIIPDGSTSYIERELKLMAASGSYLRKRFVGTKELQGGTFALRLISNNTISRPAVYGWELAMLAMARLPHAPAVFQRSFTDATAGAGPLTANLRAKLVHDHLL